MRICWQSYVNATEQAAYVDRLSGYLAEIAAPGIEYTVWDLTPPDRDLHRVSEFRCAVDVVRNAVRAEQEGFDAFAIGHFQDSGLWEARSAVDIPVLGLGETSMLWTCTVGGKAGLVTIDPVFVPIHEEQIRRYGLEQRVTAVAAIETSVDEFMRAFEDRESFERVRTQFEEQTAPMVAAGVDVIIPAGGLPTLLFMREQGFSVAGAAVLNGIAVLAARSRSPWVFASSPVWRPAAPACSRKPRSARSTICWPCSPMPGPVERQFVRVSTGVVHYASAGEGAPVVLFHQTPRSWDAYRDVLPLLGSTRRAIAMDTPGYGDSSPLPPGEDSVERWAEVAASLLDALEIERAAVVGHHTGAYVATELAACRPERVSALVLSSISISIEEERRRHASGRAVGDDVDPAPDGSHARELWRLRAAMYPPDTDLLERYLIDCLRAGPRAAGGHRVVAAYPSERRVAELACPTLLIGATADPHAYPALGALRAALPQAKCVEIEGGMVPLPDQLPAEFAAAVAEFLDEAGV
jgi:pimeloyl-ACP methyl ester carboxylesterase